jgi:hypothetical protein
VLFIFGVAAALVAGKLAGGRAERLTGLGIRWWWAAPIALVVQLLVVYGPRELIDPAAVALIVASHVGLLAVALRNWRLAGAAIAALGVAMNLAVMLANGGMMPVAPETLARAGRVEPWKIGDGSPGTRVAQSKDVILPAADTWLEPLGDRFWTGLPGRLSIVFSAGDVVLLGGVMIAVVRGMTRTRAGSTNPSEEHHDRQPTGRARLPEATAAG